MSEFASLSPNSGDIMEELDMAVVNGAEEGGDPLTTSPSLNGMMFMARNTYSPLSLEGIFFARVPRGPLRRDCQKNPFS